MKDGTMPAELRELIATKPFYREGLRQIGAMLPESDDELHDWLMQAASRGDENTFGHLLGAAALSDRKLSVSLIPFMMAFRPPPWHVAWIAWRMEGEITEELLRGLEQTVPCNLTHALSLCVAAAW